MRPCLSSFFFVWLCGHKFLPSLSPSLPVFLHLSPVFFWHAGQANPPLSTCLQTFPPVSLSPLNPCHSSSFTSLLPSYHISIPWFPLPSALPYFLSLKAKTTFIPFSYFLLFHSSPPSLPPPPPPPPLVPTLPPYRWRLTGESSAIRPRDCLLLRRWMEAPSASPTQPQLHQPP